MFGDPGNPPEGIVSKQVKNTAFLYRKAVFFVLLWAEKDGGSLPFCGKQAPFNHLGLDPRPYFVPKIRSPASPNPGTMYLCSFNLSSKLAQ